MKLQYMIIYKNTDKNDDRLLVHSTTTNITEAKAEEVRLKGLGCLASVICLNYYCNLREE